MVCPLSMSFQERTEMFMPDSTEGISKASGHMLSILLLLAGAINYHPLFVKLKRGQCKQFHPFMGIELGKEGEKQRG